MQEVYLDDNLSEESKATWWINRLIDRTNKVIVDCT